MDGLSAVSGVFAVVYLTIQLGEKIQKLRDILKSMKSAFQDVDSIIEELELLTLVIQGIKQNELQFGADPTVNLAMEACVRTIGSLETLANSFVDDLQSQNTFRREWAAFDSVRKTEQISKFKAALHATKLNLVLAQQCSTSCTTHRHFETHQTSFTVLTQSLVETSEQLAFQRRINASMYQITKSDIASSMGAEATDATGSWPVKPMQDHSNGLVGEPSNAMNTTIVKVTQDCSYLLPEQKKPFPRFTGQATLHKPYNQTKICSVFRTIFGELQYSTALPEVQGLLEYQSTIEKEKPATKAVVAFFPSRWLSQFGITGLKIDLARFTKQGMQGNLQTFNVIEDDSLIFRYCAQGNIAGVRQLLVDKRASINDITVFGMTPLHIAANNSQAELCLFSLQSGADQESCSMAWQRNAFACACWPWEAVDSNGNIRDQVELNAFLRTVQTFVRAGRDSFEIEGAACVQRIIATEANSNLVGSEIPSMWLINDILPTTHSTIMDDGFWTDILEATIYHKPGDASLTGILQNCSDSVVRHGMVLWLEYNNLESLEASKRLSKTVSDFQLMSKRLGDLNFVSASVPTTHWDRTIRTNSFVMLAMQYSYFFAKLLLALEFSSLEIEEIIQKEIALHDSGWTTETLRLMFSGPLIRLKKSGYFCKACGDYALVNYILDAPWERRKIRTMASIQLDAPLDEEETIAQAVWDDIITAHSKRLCLLCSQKEKENLLDDDSPFLLSF